MYKWFRACKTAEEGKALYHELVKKHHSDNGGNDAIMAEINDEFTRWWKEFKNIHTAADGNTYTKETQEDISEFMDILNKLSRHQNLKVDICGSWELNKAETGSYSLSSRDGLRLLTMADQKGQTTMTPEKTYQLVCEMLHSYDSATGNDAAEKVISDTSDFLRCFNPFYESAAALLLDAKTRMDKSSSSASVVSAVKRMTKAAVAGRNRLLQGMVYQNGLYCVCDSYRILRLKEDVTCVQHIENTPATPVLANLMQQDIDSMNAKLDLPAESEVKAYIARCKAVAGNTHTYSYRLEENVYVNPQYLLDMLQALPGCMCYTDADKAGKAMLYFLADNGDGVLLPVHPGTAKTI